MVLFCRRENCDVIMFTSSQYWKRVCMQKYSKKGLYSVWIGYAVPHCSCNYAAERESAFY